MKKVLVIGSTVVDVVIHLDRLPKTQEDVHVISQKMALGGCAYNTSDIIRHFGVPYILFSPIGTGAYGDFVRTQLAIRNVSTPIPSPQTDNGCCYCFVENSGERTFLSYHGAEYLFEKEWFALLNTQDIDSVYVCGLEIEETTGPNIVSWLEEHPELQVYFAPGPRITRIDRRLLKRIFALHPILHLNKEEALSFARNSASSLTSSDTSSVPSPLPSGLEGAAEYLHQQTQNTVIVTLGAEGAYYIAENNSEYVDGFPARQIDTIGAGDSHIGAIIACRHLGMDLHNTVYTANRIAAQVVETEGALLSDEAFRRAFPYCRQQEPAE